MLHNSLANLLFYFAKWPKNSQKPAIIRFMIREKVSKFCDIRLQKNADIHQYWHLRSTLTMSKFYLEITNAENIAYSLQGTRYVSKRHPPSIYTRVVPSQNYSYSPCR